MVSTVSLYPDWYSEYTLRHAEKDITTGVPHKNDRTTQRLEIYEDLHGFYPIYFCSQHNLLPPLTHKHMSVLLISEITILYHFFIL